MEQDDEEDFARGREYCDKKAFKLAVVSYVVLGKRGCYFPDSNSVKITARCKIKGCPFAVRGRLTDEGCVRVTSSHLDHSCQPLQHKTVPTLIAKTVAAMELRNRSSVKAADVRESARVWFGADVPYKQAYDALQLETQSVDMRGASYRLLKPWLDAMATANPGSVVDLVSSSDGHVERVFLALNAWTKRGQFALPVVALDACHLKSKERGTLFIASCLSPNREIIVLAAGIGMIEDGDHWEWFLEKPKEACTFISNVDVVVMSDREKGLSSAVAHVLPEVPHGYCCFHIKKNTKTECKTDFNGKITQLAKATTSTEYARLMDECEDENSAAAEYLKGIATENWISYFFPRPRFGQVTTNIAESANSWLLGEREGTWLGCLQGLTRKVQERRWQLSRDSESISGRFVPWVVAKVTKNIALGRQRLISPVSDTVIEVMRVSENTYAQVDVATRLCSCGLWTELQYPCLHACAALQSVGIDPLNSISEYYSVERLRLCYKATALPVDVGLLGPDSTKPPVIKATRERPKKVRMRNRSEYLNSDSPVHCSRCSKPGHNVRTCERRKKERLKRQKSREDARQIVV